MLRNVYLCTATFAADFAADAPCREPEDTPARALLRWEATKQLLQLLVRLAAPHSRVISHEPGKALCRWLFSSKLPERGKGSDPLLTNTVTYDRSLLTELAADHAYALKVCEQMCHLSQKLVLQLNNTPVPICMPPTLTKSDLMSGYWEVAHSGHVEFVDNALLIRLQALYRGAPGEEAPAERFTARLFCLLLRYKALGGSDNVCVGHVCDGEDKCAAMPRLLSDTMWANLLALGVTGECMASPFNCSAKRYWSAFPDTDRWFSSSGNFLTARVEDFRDGGSFMADGPPVEESLEKMANQVLAILSRNEARGAATSFVVGVPVWTDTVFWNLLHTSKWLVFCLKCTKVYNNGKMSLFILQNSAGRARWSVTNGIKQQLGTL